MMPLAPLRYPNASSFVLTTTAPPGRNPAGLLSRASTHVADAAEVHDAVAGLEGQTVRELVRHRGHERHEAGPLEQRSLGLAPALAALVALEARHPVLDQGQSRSPSWTV
jgi:hypothetical protein